MQISANPLLPNLIIKCVGRASTWQLKALFSINKKLLLHFIHPAITCFRVIKGPLALHENKDYEQNKEMVLLLEEFAWREERTVSKRFSYAKSMVSCPQLVD